MIQPTLPNPFHPSHYKLLYLEITPLNSSKFYKSPKLIPPLSPRPALCSLSHLAWHCQLPSLFLPVQQLSGLKGGDCSDSQIINNAMGVDKSFSRDSPAEGGKNSVCKAKVL